MKRIAFSSLLVSSLLVGRQPGGAGAATDSAKLIPEGAEFVGGLNLKALTGSKSYQDNKAQLEGNPDVKEVIDAAKACNLSIEGLDSVVFGGDSKEHMVVVLTGGGIGKEDNLKCIGEFIKGKNDGKEPWTIEDKDGKRILNIDGGEMIGYMPNENTVAVAQKDWAGALAELIDGKGKPAIENSLKDIFGKVDAGKHMWVGGKVPAEAGAMLPAQGLNDVVASLDLSGGVALMAAGGFADAEKAKAAADMAQAAFDQYKGMAGMIGIPAAVVDSVKIEAKDAAVHVQAKATDADLEAIKKTLEGMGGAMGGGAPADEPAAPAPTEPVPG